MAGNGPQNPGAPTGGSPPKPWEGAASSSGPPPFKPPSAGNTSDVVEASGTANPGEIVSTSDRSGGPKYKMPMAGPFLKGLGRI